MTDLSDLDSSAFWRVNPPDTDPPETREWLDAFDALVAAEGRDRATFLLRKLLDHARVKRVPLPPVLNTPYHNSVQLAEQPQFPGNLELEQRLGSIVRWNALAMVVRANKAHAELGGHIASYASAADLFEVGFNHFFRGGGAGAAQSRGDLVFFQPHSAPGVYARAFLEGRLSEAQLDRYRRETARRRPLVVSASVADAGLLAVSDRLDGPRPDQRDLPGALHALPRRSRPLAGQPRPQGVGLRRRRRDGRARVARRPLAGGARRPRQPASSSSTAICSASTARCAATARIIQELEGLFAGAGWNVIKLLVGLRLGRAVRARRRTACCCKRLHETVDGEFQTYAATDGRFNREHFFNKYPELQALVAHMTDEDIDRLRRGGHDPVKIHAAYRAAMAPSRPADA